MTDTITKLHVDNAKALADSTKLASFYGPSPPSIYSTIYLRNLHAVQHLGMAIVQSCGVKVMVELNKRPDGIQGSLFHIPEDHELNHEWISDMFDEIKRKSYGMIAPDEDRFEDAPTRRDGGIAERLFDRIAMGGTLSPSDINGLQSLTEWDDVDHDDYMPRLWALAHTGHFTHEGDEFVCVKDTLVDDIESMLKAQPGLGTQEGLEDGEEIETITLYQDDPYAPIDAEYTVSDGIVALADVVIDWMLIEGNGSPVGFLDSNDGEAGDVCEAFEHLVSVGKLSPDPDNANKPEGFASSWCYYIGAERLKDLKFAKLKESFQMETGASPGKLKKIDLIDALISHREEVAASDSAVDSSSDENGSEVHAPDD